MHRLVPLLILVGVVTLSAGCDRSAASSSQALSDTQDPSSTQAISPPDSQVEDQPNHLTPVSHTESRRQRLTQHRLDLENLTARLWPKADAEAGLNWLQTSAAGSGLELTKLSPGSTVERDGLEIRPYTVRAEGDWPSVVDWLQAIESSPREFGLQIMGLQTVNGRVVTEINLAILIDRTTAPEILAGRDVAELNDRELGQAIRLTRAERSGIQQAFDELGAETSWSQPIAELTALLPDAARPLRMTLKPADPHGDTKRFTGRFTLEVPDAGLVPSYVRGVQKQPGFVEAGLASLRRDGNEWQRASVTFSFAGQTPSAPNIPTELAEVVSE
ncbi:MAG: type 4a pilus biogenesis protein PilO [Planctomycetota bacterium]